MIWHFEITPYYLTTLHVTCEECYVCVCVCMYVNKYKYVMGILHHSCNVFLLLFHFRHYTYYGKEICIVSNLDDIISVWDTYTLYMILQVIDMHLF